MTTSEVIVVGAGIAGASVAYELQAFCEVTLLEREGQPGDHATGRSAATFAPAYGNRVIRALSGASRAFYDEPSEPLFDQPVLRPRGELFIARNDQADRLERFYLDMKPLLPDLEPLQAEQVLDLVPVLRPSYVVGGVYDRSAMDMDVAAIHQGYLRGFRERGGRLVTDAEVVEIGQASLPWQVRTRAGVFEAPVVVNAAGAWADQLAMLAGVPPLALTPMRRTAFVFEPSIPLDPAWPGVVDADERFYFKPEAGLGLGSPGDQTPVPPQDVQPEADDVALAVDRIERASRLRVLRIRRRWAGLRTFAPDRIPVVGMDEVVPGFFWLAGQGGYGIQMAPALARTGASLLVEGVVPDDVLDLGVTAEDLMPLRLRMASEPLAVEPEQ